jgi:hypothetical protein
LAAADLRISEFMASNERTLLDAQGEARDWLEIYNPSAEPVNLAGMHLTDTRNNLSRWTFPAGSSIAAGGYLVVFASNKNTVLAGGELHTNFALSAGGEYLALVAADGTTIIHEYAPSFPTQVEDISYGYAMQPTGQSTKLIADRTQARAWVPTNSALDAIWTGVGFNDSVFNIVGPTGFGYENAPGDAINFTAELGTIVPSTTRSLYMRQKFTLSTLAGIDQLVLSMRYDDGFVAYLNGQRIAQGNAPESVQWNSVATSSRADSLAEQFTNFDVSAFISKLRVGENVLAIHGLNVASSSDMLISTELIATAKSIVSPARLGYFEAPTPGYGNGMNFLGFVDKPTFNLPHGYYTTAQSVTITPPPGANVVYTTNGSTPTVNANLTPTNGTLYTGPIAVSATTTLRAVAFRADYRPSFVAASTYLFLNDVVNQSPLGQTPPGFAANGLNGQQMDYGIDPDIIALYGVEAVKASLQSLPAISITTDTAHLFDATTGIYVNALNDGRDWERPASVELINANGAAGFSVNAGLRIRGGYSRNDFNPKHAFRLYFRGEYGDAKLRYPLFGSEGTDEFDVIDLRTESNYSWSSRGDVQNTFLREVFSRDLQGELGEPYTRSRYYHLYLDGVYWGVYQTQERVEENYAATYLGGEPEDYDVVKAGRMDGGGTQVNEGNDAAWFQLFTLAQNLADSPAANANNYWTMQGLNPDGTRNPQLPVLLDVDNLINFMMIVIYTGGFDTGLSQFFGNNEANNWYGVYNRVAADRGFQFFVHDNEHSLGANEGGAIHGTQFIDRTGPFNTGNQSVYAYFNPQYLHQDLLAHAAYRQRIVEKAQEYLFGNGPMTPAASIARLQKRIPQIEPAIIAESARWGDAKTTTPLNKSHWQAEVNWLINSYFPGRTATVIAQLQADGLYATPPTFSLPAGAYPTNSPLTLAAIGGGSGVVYYTVDGASDPRLPSGAINPAALAYSSPLPLAGNPTIKARFRTFAGGWSTLVEVSYSTFPAGDYNADLRIDGNDFLTWQRQLGSLASVPGAGADGNRNGVIDAGDLAAWRYNYATWPGLVAGDEPAVAAAVTLGPLVTSLDVSPAGVESKARPARERTAEIDLALESAQTWMRAQDMDPRPAPGALRRASWQSRAEDIAPRPHGLGGATLDRALSDL